MVERGKEVTCVGGEESELGVAGDHVGAEGEFEGGFGAGWLVFAFFEVFGVFAEVLFVVLSALFLLVFVHFNYYFTNFFSSRGLGFGVWDMRISKL